MSLRSATKERGMRVPGLGETNAHICDEEVEQLLRYLHGNALLLVSCHLSHVVHPDKFSHSEHSPSFDKQDIGDPSALYMPYERGLCQDMRRAGQGFPILKNGTRASEHKSESLLDMSIKGAHLSSDIANASPVHSTQHGTIELSQEARHRGKSRV